jgi:hypothetical protein
MILDGVGVIHAAATPKIRAVFDHLSAFFPLLARNRENRPQPSGIADINRPGIPT